MSGAKTTSKTVLVTGFGPFPGVSDNPTIALVRALDGRVVDGVRFVAAELPVSYRRGPEVALASIQAERADAVLGFGVATRIDTLQVETRGRWVPEGSVDIEGQTATLLDGDLADGDACVPATWPPGPLADALGASTSDDAGSYVCNAWLYQVAAKAKVPAGFVHVPASGADPDAVAAAVAKALPSSLLA
jgi:pyroglutamyl-peptidase